MIESSESLVGYELKTQIEISLYKHRTETTLRENEERLRLLAG